jgi:predicted nucleotidyltransferase
MPVASDANQVVEQRRAQLSSELQRFVTIITARMRPERIIVFGSFATGRIKEWSDLDLVVVARTDLPFYQRLDHVYRSVEPQVGLDVLVYTPEEWADLTATRRFVQEEVVEKGRVLYECPC